MGTYTDYDWIKSRIGFKMLRQFLEEQLPDDAQTDEAADEVLDDYVEDEIVASIDSRINQACVRQIDVPVSSSNTSFGMLRAIARAMLIREVYAHSPHPDIPPKIENAFIDATMQLTQIARGNIVLTQDDETGPGEDGDSVNVDVTEDTDSWDEDLADSW